MGGGVERFGPQVAQMGGGDEQRSERIVNS